MGSDQVWEGKIFVKNPPEKVWRVYIQMFFHVFRRSAPQQFEKDEGIYYTDIYQLDIVPENKNICKGEKKSRKCYWVYWKLER